MRIACLLVPDLPLRAELRAHPERRGLPVAIATGTDARAEVLVASPEARAAGVQVGAPIAQARIPCPRLQTVAASPALERAARATLLDIALSFTPRAALSPRGEGLFTSEAAVFLDATGVASIFRSEREYAASIVHRAEKLGLPGGVCIAASRRISLLAARQQMASSDSEPRHRVIEPGSEPRFLAPLPIDFLGPSEPIAQALSRFGVRRVGDLLRLPKDALVRRLGSEALRLVRMAEGSETEVALPCATETRLQEAIDFEVPIGHLEPLRFALRGLLSRLTQRLEVRGLASGPLDLEFTLEGGGRDARNVGLAAPTNDHRILMRLVILTLESHPLHAPIEAVALSTVGIPPRKDQLDLFRPPGPSSAALDRTLSELEALCGTGRVGSPQVADDHRPNAFHIAPFCSDTRPLGSAPTASAPAGQLAVRALRPPVLAHVRTEKGFPAQIHSAVTNGRVVQAAGPWRTTGHWWSEAERFASDSFDVQISDGTVARLRFDWIQKEWHIDALYD